MNNHKLLAIVRILAGSLGIIALATQLINSIQSHLNIANFFSFFTIESNILASLLLLALGIGNFAKLPIKQLALIRGAITLYMTMTGIIFVLLLAGQEAQLQTSLPWVNLVLHYVLPAVVLIDWLAFPPKQRIHFRHALTWLGFPFLYLCYSLIRGRFTQWYPYPFLNPVQSGWPNVIGVTLVITLGTIFFAWALSLRTTVRRRYR